jgi:hypothetical protein
MEFNPNFTYMKLLNYTEVFNNQGLLVKNLASQHSTLRITGHALILQFLDNRLFT